MTYEGAKKLLATAPRGDTPSRINPSLTQKQVVGIIEKGMVNTFKYSGATHDLFQKRVWQCVKNQKRPRYEYTECGED